MKKIIILLIFGMLILNIANVSAFFFWSHEKWVIQAFEDTNSDWANKCRPYLQVVIDGDLGSDSGVIYYSDSNDLNRKSYIFPHTLQGYNNCIKEAGSDIGSQCLCLGNYMHILQDSFSHNQGGIVEQGLRKYLGNNYLGHMTLERNFENEHKTLIEKENPVIYSKVNDNDKKVLNSFMISTNTGCPNGESSCLTVGGKYLTLLNRMGGIDMSNSVDTVRRGYLGVGFYDAVYKDKVSLPTYPYILVPAIMIILSLIVILTLFIFGKTWWKWSAMVIWLLILIGGILVFISFYTGNSWKIVTMIIEIPPKFGYLSVDSGTVNTYDKLIQKATDDFLKDPSVASSSTAIQDASGLSYLDANGVWHDGYLSKAESGYKYILMPIVFGILLLINIWILLKAFGIKIRR